MYVSEVANPPVQDAVCWILSGPVGTPAGGTIVEQLNGGNKIDTNFIPPNGFPDGLYKIKFGECVTGGLTNAVQRCIGINNGTITFVTAQVDLPIK